MKKTYVNAKAEIVAFATNDVIATSSDAQLVFDDISIGENGASIEYGKMFT